MKATLVQVIIYIVMLVTLAASVSSAPCVIQKTFQPMKFTHQLQASPMVIQKALSVSQTLSKRATAARYRDF